ncbi:MAG TPA: DNA-processing protein DprA [Candidatus Acidoferrales bacterium]|nr:DNA-processing protein DprA [Candidatus Acidoferrales bacterium]
MEPDRYLGWLALALTPGLGARHAGKLLRELGSPEAIFAASLTTLESARLPAAVAQAIHSQKPLRDAETELAEIRKNGCGLLTWDEPAYPQRLREIYDPPPLLYVRGNPELLDRYSIAIVGTRRPTPYGVQLAERLAQDLAERGLVIVSGLARGVDSCAHKGALASARGATVGVLGSGIDVVYPKENKKLFAKMEERGAIITEFPLGSFPAPQNFPIRNRVIAGMALGVVVVEGAQYSGSLITARLAMEFGREVFGVPGNVTQPASFGPNLLIKQGAKLVTGWEDVIEELPTEIRAQLFPVEASSQQERAALFEESLSESERTLFALLSTDQARHVDELVEQSGLNSSEVLAALFELEMKSYVRQFPGKNFVKVLL